MYIDPSQYETGGGPHGSMWTTPGASLMGDAWDTGMDTVKSVFQSPFGPLLGGSDGGGVLGGVSGGIRGGIDRALGGLLGDSGGEPDWARALPNHGGYGRDPGDIGVY